MAKQKSKRRQRKQDRKRSNMGNNIPTTRRQGFDMFGEGPDGAGRELVDPNTGESVEGIFHNGAYPDMPTDAQERALSLGQPKVMDLASQFLSPRREVSELLKTYSNSPWLRAVVNKIARSVAETNWKLFAVRNQDRQFFKDEYLLSKLVEDRNRLIKEAVDVENGIELTTHPLLTMLRAGTGDPKMNGFSSLLVTQAHLDLVGEAFWMIESDQLGVPTNYWPLPPNWIKKFPSASHPFWAVNTDNASVVDVPESMIIPFIDPNPANPYGRGTGIAKSLDDEIQLDEYAAKHAKSFFLNRARPDVIISGSAMTRDDARRMEVQWKNDHQGFFKAFKPLFFNQKIDVQELTQSFESLQMVQVRKHERDVFVSVYGSPPEKFGIIGESKRSTIAAADMFWNKDLIKPRQEMLCRTLQENLVSMFDERLILTYETTVIQDEEFKLGAMKMAPWAATLNEWREMQGFPSLGKAGEVIVMPLNMQPIPVVADTPLALPENEEGNDNNISDDEKFIARITQDVIAALESQD